MAKEFVQMVVALQKRELWISGVIVLGLCLAVFGVGYFIEGTYVPLASRLSMEQSIRLTKILKQENIRYRLTSGGREILVRSSVRSQISTREDIQQVIGEKKKELPTGASSALVQVSNDRSLDSINQVNQKQMKAHSQWTDGVQEALQQQFGAGVSRVHVYQAGKYDPWGLGMRVVGASELSRTHLVLTVLFDMRWIERQARRKLMEAQKGTSSEDLSALSADEKAWTQLDVEYAIHQRVADIFTTQKDKVTYHLLVGFRSFEAPESEAQFSRLKGIFPLGGLGLVLFLCSFLVFRAGVTFMRSTLSSL